MPIQTDLSASPHFDDFDENKGYYKILFQPGVAVQTRELNQLQTMLQNQIEKFGDNILKRGTIVAGCNITYWPRLPYVKIKDLATDGTPVNINQLNGYYLRNSNNLESRISVVEQGLETSSPNLKTLFISYINSGDDLGQTVESSKYAADQILTVYDPKNPVFKINITNGSSGFSNADTVVVTSSMAIQNSTGGKDFTIGTRVGLLATDIIKSDGLAIGQIVGTPDTTTLPDAVIVRVAPLADSLRAGDNRLWTFYENSSVEISAVNTTNKSTANKISKVYGYGAAGSLVTDSLGKVTSISVTNGGLGYDYDPYISVSSSTATASEISQFAASAQRFLTTISVAGSVHDPVGFGYGVSVDEGYIYQKGYFIKVDEQLAVVEKYNNIGFDKSVGFVSNESIIDSNTDETLLDNATGAPNFTAPGAKRLKLQPVLTVLEKAEADLDSEFFPIVEFSQGSPYITQQETVYNKIGDLIAKRTAEESGNYVIDKFNVISKDQSNTAAYAASFNINIDPGLAYINGYRVKTEANYIGAVDKGTDTFTKENASTIFSYGDFFRVNQLAGNFRFDVGDLVEFYDTARQYITTQNPGSAITPAGNKIGTARVRSIVLESGYAGTASAVYRVYTFDRVFVSGKTANDIKAIYHGGATYPGICDILQENNETILYDKNYSSLLFRAGVGVQSVGDTFFYYKASNPFNIGSTGTLDISVEDPLTESFDIFSENTIAENEIVIVPTDNFQISANLAGTVSVSATNTPIVAGTSTQFLSQLAIGDWIKIDDSSSNIFQVQSIENDTTLTVTKNVGSVITSKGVKRYFPKYIPISLSTPNSTRTAKIETEQLKINLGIPSGMTLANTSGSTYSPPVVVNYNVKKKFTPPVTKGTSRSVFARIRVANNSAGTDGPWALGASDVFRLRSVYKANTASRTSTFYTNSASIDNASDFIATLSQHRFANGDLVVYTTDGASAAITGLSNNATYKVALANTSGFKLANVATGSTIAITPDAQDKTHNLTGSSLYFTADTFGAEDVTNQFYIDNNQNPDYLDTSYLVRKPSGTAITTNDSLLVEFDAFTPSSSEGLKTINSYQIDDIHALDDIETNKVNTLEIPELYDNATDKYYDLRDQFDLRPASANTIPLLNEAGGGLTSPNVINPIEPIDGILIQTSFNASANVNASTDTITITAHGFVSGDVVQYFTGTGTTGILANNSVYYVRNATADTLQLTDFTNGPSGAIKDLSTGTGTAHNLKKSMLRFSENKKYFPVPGSTCTSDITTYLGRTDRVVVTTGGNFNVIKGIPGKINDVPPEPADSMTINLLRVPPYPSIPQVLSATMAELADTKILNQKEMYRKNNFKVATLLSPNEQSLIQVKPYRMTDIAQLERRIKDLERYVTITLTETIARSRFIGSSTNSALDRFKFGFFVDSFVDYNFADASNPEFSATIFNDRLNPKSTQINIEMTYDIDDENVVGKSFGSYTYEDYTLINQADATSGEIPVVVTPDPVFEETITQTTITQITSTSIGQYRSSARDGNKTVWEDWSYTMSSLPGPVRLYVNARDQRVQIEVFQGTTPNFTPTTPIATSLSWQQWSNADRAFGGEAYQFGGKWEDGNWSSYPWVEDCFKMNWSHNPANGQYYIIRVYKGKHDGGLFGGNSPKGFYMFKLYYPSDQIETTTTQYVGKTPFEYTGRVYSQAPETFTLTEPVNYIDLGFMGSGFSYGAGYIADSQKFDISITGLRPLTRHSFYLEQEDQTAKCVQIRTDNTAGTSGLVSDKNGVLTFSYYYDAGINEATTDFEQQNKLAASLAGRKIYKLSNIDGTSSASGAIEMKYYLDSTQLRFSGLGATLNNTTTVTATTTQVTNEYTNLTRFDLVDSLDTNLR